MPVSLPSSSQTKLVPPGGYYPEQHILDLNSRLVMLLKAEGAFLDALYYCPHLEGGSVPQYSFACQCRKPETGMVEQAFSQHPDLDRNLAYVIGDKSTDVELARNCGAKGILVKTGYGEAVLKGEYQWTVEPDFQAGKHSGRGRLDSRSVEELSRLCVDFVPPSSNELSYDAHAASPRARA